MIRGDLFIIYDLCYKMYTKSFIVINLFVIIDYIITALRAIAKHDWVRGKITL